MLTPNGDGKRQEVSAVWGSGLGEIYIDCV